MKHKLRFLAVPVIIIAIALTGCCGGGKTTVVTESTKTTTKGQELQDLKKANEEGVISEKEYEKAKKKVLKED